MDKAAAADIRNALLELLPEDGTSLGNLKLRTQIAAMLGAEVPEDDYSAARDALVAEGLLAKGQGRGGSVRRIVDHAAPLTLEVQEKPVGADAPKPKQPGLTLAQAKRAKAEVKAKRTDEDNQVIAYRHDQKRRNNPDVGVVTPDNDPEQPRTQWAYDPHIDPALQFDVGRAQIETLIDNALSSGDEATMRAALEQLKRQAAPYLNWTGKAERTSFEVDTVSLHVHERIDPASILAVIQKRMQADAGKAATGDMFRAWFEEPLPLREAVDFYRHDRGWSNRLVAGDSLLVMNSLLQKEGMAGQVQMIYIDPPYGIKYGSNFQPFVNKRDVKDGKDEDLTQEPEMIKAFRDTWELGIHSYLTYLRDRLLLAKELLHESGSVFVQISDENLHHVRELLDEIFGSTNFRSVIPFRTSSPLGASGLPTACDFLVWYAKDAQKIKFNQLYQAKEIGLGTNYMWIEECAGLRRRMNAAEAGSETLDHGRVFYPSDLASSGYTPTCTFGFSAFGHEVQAGKKSWRTNQGGVNRLLRSNRIMLLGDRGRPCFVQKFNDYSLQVISNLWTDTRSAMGKSYVVETDSSVIERCLLMTTDPSDLILGPVNTSATHQRPARN